LLLLFDDDNDGTVPILIFLIFSPNVYYQFLMFLAWEVLCGYLRYVLEHIMYGFLLPLGGISLSMQAMFCLVLKTGFTARGVWEG
jgi:hypothetical protein